MTSVLLLLILWLPNIKALSSCMKETKVVHDYDRITNLENDGWTSCYFEAYSTHTSFYELITNCPSGDDYYLFFGALQTSTDSKVYLGAFTTSITITDYTISRTAAYIPYGLDDGTYNVYWYNYMDKAIGFSSTSIIDLSDGGYGGDYNDKTDNDRLSWSLSAHFGGYRAGTYIDLRLSDIWHKIVYYKQCETIVTPSPFIDTSCILNNNIVHNYHIKNNLIIRNWTICYDEYYAGNANSNSDGTKINTLITDCPTGDDIYYFVGSKVSPQSPLIYLGAFVSSIILTQVTASTTTAYIPYGMNNSEYTVYWYNYVGEAIGFSPTSDVSLDSGYGGDTYDEGSDNDRLSWSTKDFGPGGFRAGIWSDLRLYDDGENLFRKIIYYKQCIDESIATPAPSVDITLCNMENEVVHDYHINNNLIARGWTKCYDDGYSQAPTNNPTEIEVLINQCPMGDDYYLFVGAKTTKISPLAYMGAYVASNILSTYTDSTTIAYIPYPIDDKDYKVYWYNYFHQSFGFASSKHISLTEGYGGDNYYDQFEGADNNRLSWSTVSFGAGGYRAGIWEDLRSPATDNMWRKIIYYKQCLSDGWKPQSIEAMDGLCIMNNVVHNYDINLNLINNGWTICYKAPYLSHTDIATLITDCNVGSDYYIFVGALPTNKSTLAFLGAFGPSSVLSTDTTSTTAAYIPERYNTSPNYNVYWYNNPDQAFGFASSIDISLDVGYGGDAFNAYDGTTDNDRLSWSRFLSYGGYRAGIHYLLTSPSFASMWTKVIYYKYCPPTPAPTPAPTSAPTLAPSNAPTVTTNSPTVAPSLTPSFSPSLFPSNSPSSPPTLAPSDSPSSAPTDSPYRMIKVNGSYICSQLSDNIGIIYDISYNDCVYSQCLYIYTSKCSMINYVDSKCYIFDKQCEIYADNTNNDNLMAIQGWKSDCIDYPKDWLDKSGDSCYDYSYILSWCDNQWITNISNFNDQSKDIYYNLDGSEACCDCGGGAFLRNDVILEFSKYSKNILNELDELICSWPYGHKSKWHDYDNIDLYDLCDESNQLNEQQINCNIIIDKSYSGDDQLILCNFDQYDDNNNDDLYFLSMFTMDTNMISTIYINQHWFSLDESLLFIANKPLIYYNYTDCISSLSSSEIIHGVFLCDADTLSPSISPTNGPTKSPTNKLTETQTNQPLLDQLSELFASNNIEQLSFFINISLITFYIILICLALFHAKTKHNDFFKAGNVMEALLQSLDMISDIFFAVDISIKYGLGDSSFGIMIIASWVFIIIPIIFSILQLYIHSNYEWYKNKRISQWLINNIKYLFIISLFTGTPFAAILLMNSNMFNLKIFCMGLDKEQRNKFATKRIYSVIICEDIPQLIIQSIFLYKIKSLTLISIFSILFSSISVIITILSMISVRKIYKKQNHIKFTINISGRHIASSKSIATKNTKNVKNEISDILGESSSILEIFPPTKIPNGLQLELHLYINNGDNDNTTQYEQYLNNAINDGTLTEIFIDHWKLNITPHIQVQCELISSDSKSNTRETELVHHTQLASDDY